MFPKKRQQKHKAVEWRREIEILNGYYKNVFGIIFVFNSTLFFGGEEWDFISWMIYAMISENMCDTCVDALRITSERRPLNMFKSRRILSAIPVIRREKIKPLKLEQNVLKY